ncbi:MAG: polysaccharide pyruvyl transferase family protein [Clostridia bacterium]|nr:polysaccharide pyruvyl transferase family protein [Clostridia bacterium]MBQ7122251.1 polysaccharide pyruvyl transferase family protein [Clostridia bacterium]
MKIGILTHYQVESHGACLQHYALTRFLKDRGHEVYTLSYNKSFDFANNYEQKKFSLGIRSVPFYIKEYLFKQGPVFIRTMAKKHSLLQKFNKKHFSFLPYCDCGVDAAVIGSDEVWSLQLGANIMMYGHGVDAKKLISYAPSFGQTDIERIEKYHCRSLIENGLKSFDSLSARDITSCRIAEELTGREVSLVCDPALLYGFEKELSGYHRMSKEKYVVVYAYNSNMNEPERVEAIRRYAASTGAKVFSVGGFHKWCDKQIACDPIDMLYWFKGAQAVFTDTFHGTITAFLTQTPMAVYVRNTNNVKLDHLLSVLSLESRKVMEDRSIFEILEETVDYSRISKEFEPFRKACAEYLEQSLSK